MFGDCRRSTEALHSSWKILSQPTVPALVWHRAQQWLAFERRQVFRNRLCWSGSIRSLLMFAPCFVFRAIWYSTRITKPSASDHTDHIRGKTPFRTLGIAIFQLPAVVSLVRLQLQREPLGWLCMLLCFVSCHFFRRMMHTGVEGKSQHTLQYQSTSPPSLKTAISSEISSPAPGSANHGFR